MNIYIINIIVVLTASFLCKYKIKGLQGRVIDGTRVYSFIVCFSFSFIMAFRDLSIGVDTAPYSRIFGIISNSQGYIDAIYKAPLTAPAYIIFCKTLSFISKDPQIVVIASSLIINIGMMMIINKVSKSAPISYLSWIGLTLFYCSMNGSRQCISLVLALYALILMTKNLKNVKAWIIFSIAVLTHSTSLILFFAIAGIMLANKLSDNRLLFLISGIASAVIALVYGVGVRLVLRFFPRYSMYTSGESKYSIFNSTGGGRIVLLYLVLLGIVFLWMLKNSKTETGNRDFVAKMFPAVLFCAVFGIVNSKNELINRLLWYYLGIFTLFIPSVFIRYRKYEKLILKLGIIGILLAYSMLSLLENQNGVVPYRFFGDD